MLTNSSSEPLILGVDIGYGNVKVYGSQHRGAEVPQQFLFPALAVPCDDLAESGTNFLQAHQATRVCVEYTQRGEQGSQSRFYVHRTA